MGVRVFGQIVSFEGTSFPEIEGWVRSSFCTPVRSLQGGWLVEELEPKECFAPPSGDRDTYRLPLDEYDGVESFFAEWRVEADGNRTEITWGAPSAFALGSFGPVRYTFFIARDQAKLNRDNLLPIVFVDLAPDLPHTHRLELYADELYIWFIDGRIVDSGIPEGAFPSNSPRINFQSQSAFLPCTVKWDYVRYGTIPFDGSGDFDSDGDHDLRDFYFLHECILGVDRPIMRGGVDPGCLWADVNPDGVIDLIDFAEFQIAFTGSE